MGLTEQGLKARITNRRLELTESEVIDLFFLYPTLVDVEWKNRDIVGAQLNGLNLKFIMRK